MENSTHVPVLLESSLTELKVKKDGLYIDCTLGAGGHSEAILKKGGKVLGIEADESMLKLSEERLNLYCPTLVRGNFKDIETIAKEHQFFPVDGVLMDLGISNLHYEVIGRGFSYKKASEPLDMRLSPRDIEVTAATLLNVLSESQLITLFEPVLGYSKSRSVTRRIVQRREKPFVQVSDLVEVSRNESPEVFLALRIAVNSEFDVIDEGIKGAMQVLTKGGRLVIISFHSLEDQRVAHAFKRFEKEGIAKVITKTPIVPTGEEVAHNPKSRSALLRTIEKI